MMKHIRIFMMSLGLLSASCAFADVTPIAISLFPPAQFPNEAFTVSGLRISAIHSNHRKVYGIDIGAIGNSTSQTFTGIGISGVFNMNKGMTNVVGLQLAGITNLNASKTNVVGLQAALGLNSNLGESSVIGLQVAAANYSPYTKVYGFQVGIYNRAQVVTGFQIGLINDTENLHGFQIGLLNFHRKGMINVAPILNVGF